MATVEDLGISVTKVSAGLKRRQGNDGNNVKDVEDSYDSEFYSDDSEFDSDTEVDSDKQVKSKSGAQLLSQGDDKPKRVELTEDTVEIYKDFPLVKHVYFSRTLGKRDSAGDIFVVTEGFKKVIDHLNDGTDVSIVGPRGVGKSMALAAIATVCHGKIPCFLWSPYVTFNKDFQDYVENFYEELHRIKPSDPKKTPEFRTLTSCLTALAQISGMIFLLELGSLSEYTPEMEHGLVCFGGASSLAQIIVSQSSGRCNFQNGAGTPSRMLESLNNNKRIEFLPFTEEEFQCYKEIHDVPLNPEDTIRLTNYNPLLLSSIRHLKGDRVMNKIFAVVRLAIWDISKSLVASKFKWIEQSLEMLVYAANGVKISKSHYYEYLETWVCAENITYISRRYMDGSFVLEMNFPTCYSELLCMLHGHRNEKSVRPHSRILDEIYFEDALCKKIKQLEVVYSKSKKAIPRRDDLEAITFKFTATVCQRPCTPLTGLAEGVLYQLRSCHPVIDAVAYIKKDSIQWLLLIQVSLSAYKYHESHIEDLNKPVVGCEKVRPKRKPKRCKRAETNPPAKKPKIEPNDWLKYYYDMLPESKRTTKKCMYIYISPKNIVDKQVSDLKDYNNLRNNSYGANHVDVFFGLILRNSTSADLISYTSRH